MNYSKSSKARLLVVLFTAVCHGTFAVAGPCHSNMVGVITPCGIIDLYIGQALRINCMVNDHTVAPSGNESLMFKRGVNETPLPQEYQQSHGKASVTLEIPHASVEDSSTYYCFLGSGLVAPPVTVKVDHRPVAPSNLSCVVDERQTEMTCTWLEPITYREPENITYDVTYNIGSSDEPCPWQTRTSCRWGVGSFIAIGLYSVTITVSDGRTSSSATFTVDPLKFVTCDPVRNMQVAMVTSTCIQATWSATVQPASEDFKKTFSVSCVSAADPTHQVEVLVEGGNSTRLCGLAPNTLYEISIRCRLGPLKPWNNPTNISATTAKDYPNPPSTCDGCFYVGSQEEATLFWQALKQEEAHGTLTGYKIHISDGRETATDGVATSVVINGLDRSLDYAFHLYSKNEMGLSRNFTQLVRSAKSAWPNDVADLHVTVTSPEEVTLHWSVGELHSSQYHVTAVWCQKAESFNGGCGCKGQLRWRDVGDVRQGQITLPGTPDTTLYGLTVRSPSHVSSGIRWVECQAGRDQRSDGDSKFWLLALLVVPVVAIGLCILCICRKCFSQENLPVTYPLNGHDSRHPVDFREHVECISENPPTDADSLNPASDVHFNSASDVHSNSASDVHSPSQDSETDSLVQPNSGEYFQATTTVGNGSQTSDVTPNTGYENRNPERVNSNGGYGLMMDSSHE